MLAGRLASVAVAVKVRALPQATMSVGGTPASTGATFTSFTVMVTCCWADRTGVPLSATLTVKVKLPGPCASVGVQENAPVAALMAAPTGAFTSEKASVLAGRSASVAVAVKVSCASSFTV